MARSAGTRPGRAGGRLIADDRSRQKDGREAVVKIWEFMMILDLHRQGLSVAAIARETGKDAKTIRRYIARGLEPPVNGPLTAAGVPSRSVQGVPAGADHGLSAAERPAPAAGGLRSRLRRRLYRAQPVQWPRSSARMMGVVGVPPASAAIGADAVTLASARCRVRVRVAMIVSTRVVVLRMPAGTGCEATRQRQPGVQDPGI